MQGTRLSHRAISCRRLTHSPFFLFTRCTAFCAAPIPHASQEAFYGKDVVLADRNVVESEADSIYATAKDEDVSFLVVGDPLCATTHTDLIIRARELGVKVGSERAPFHAQRWKGQSNCSNPAHS